MALIEDSVVVVERKSRKYYRSERSGGKDISYVISPFMSVRGKINYVKVSDSPSDKTYYVRFRPYYRVFEIYPNKICRPEELITRRSYDLDKLSISKTHIKDFGAPAKQILDLPPWLSHSGPLSSI